jgi:hypothetical protein
MAKFAVLKAFTDRAGLHEVDSEIEISLDDRAEDAEAMVAYGMLEEIPEKQRPPMTMKQAMQKSRDMASQNFQE